MRSQYCYLLRIVIPKLIKRYYAPTPHGGGVAVGLGSPRVVGIGFSLSSSHLPIRIKPKAKPTSIAVVLILPPFCYGLGSSIRLCYATMPKPILVFCFSKVISFWLYISLTDIGCAITLLKPKLSDSRCALAMLSLPNS